MPADRPAVEWRRDGRGKAHAVKVRFWNGTDDMYCGRSLVFPPDADDSDPRCPECERRVKEERKP